MDENNILGVVLAGGKSKRFGKDKANVKLGNKTLIQHTLDKIKSKFSKIIVVSNTEVVKDYTIVKDCINGQLGPLVGVLSAMKWIKKNNYSYEWIITFPCDTPFFSISIIDRFINAAKLKNSFLYFVKSEDKRHNIFGLWSLKLVNTLEEDINKNEYRKVEKWANKIGVKTINVTYEKMDPFFNINTKEELAEAEKILLNYKND
tara:strand:+ start:399 stop:1010 length:612 start_codon:yes stop_codon:yes gene_type:complete